MIINKPITQEQLRAKQLAVDKQFQDDLDRAYDFVITDLMTRISDLERKEAISDDRGTDS